MLIKNKRKLNMKELLIISFGTALTAVAVVNFFEPLEVVTGGVTGIAIILQHLFGIPMWLVNVACNLPLFIAGFRLLNRKSWLKTLYAAANLSLFLAVIPPVSILTGDKLVDSVLGGVIMGAGLGFVFLQNASSGGADMFATLLNLKFKHISVPKLLVVVDGIIVIAGALLFGAINGIYAFVALFVMSRVSDLLLEGPNRAKLMYIISVDYQKISSYIVNELERGVTCIPAQGQYTHEFRPILLCVVSAKEMVNVKQKLYTIDPRAICFVGDIREAFGEGFTTYTQH